MTTIKAVSSEEEKKRAGRYAADLVQGNQVVGLGTGSTARHAIARLGERMAAGELSIRGVCTSRDTEQLAREAGIPVLPLSAQHPIKSYIDGADQVNPQGTLIKGGGGALLWEKMVATAASRRIIIVDGSKTVPMLGKTFPLPVEIVRFGHTTILERLEAVPGCRPVLRQKGGEDYVTDEGHFIADCHFDDGIDDAESLNTRLKLITGVVETGLFLGLCDVLVVGRGDQIETKEFSR